MASFLLGDEYASSSSSEASSSPIQSPVSESPAAVSTSSIASSLPSADELFASDTSGVLTASLSTAATGKRKSDEPSRPASKAVKVGNGKPARKPKIAPFAPPQLRRPNISTEDRGLWNTNKTMALQRKAKREASKE